MKRTSQTLTATLAAALALSPVAALASDHGKGASFSDSQLESFAEAASDVARIQHAALPKLRAADSQEAVKRVEDKARTQMEEAIRDAGISLKTYTQIGQALQGDKDLQNRVRTLMQGQN